MFTRKIADSTGVEMTGGSLLMRTLIFRRLLLRDVLEADERFVGLLVPPSAGGVLANAAVTLCAPRGRQSELHRVVRDAELLHRPVRHRARADQPQVHGAVRFQARCRTGVPGRSARAGDHGRQTGRRHSAPTRCRPRCSSAGSDCTRSKPDELFTIIYTSGSTGQPKGVMLSYKNVGTNVGGDRRHAAARRTRHGAGHPAVVPFVRLHGRPVVGAGAWTAKACYHFSPLDAKIIGKMCKRLRK